MAKPINLYQGPAPAAMAQMGAGMAEVGANIGRTLQGGYESMGKSLAGGITSLAGAYKEYKDDQAKFDATKKMVKAFEGYLPKQKDPVTGKEFSPMADELKGFLNDTTISTREKVAMTPMVMSFLGNAQQQYGRENVANIMNKGRVEAAGARRPAPITDGSFGGVRGVDDYMNLPTNSSQGNPAPLQSTQQQGSPMMSVDGSSVYNPKTGKWVRLDNNAMTGEIVPDNYYDDPDNLIFDPRTKRIKQ
jgi:hypothetical protein